MKKTVRAVLIAAIGTGSVVLVSATARADNPFAAHALTRGYAIGTHADAGSDTRDVGSGTEQRDDGVKDKGREGKCGEGKCGTVK